MSSQNRFPGQGRAQPSVRPGPQEQQRQPSWINPQVDGQASAPRPGSAWPPQAEHGYQDGYAPASDYGGHAPQAGSQPPQSAPDYGHWAELQPGYGNQGGAPLNDPFAPQFEPYTPADAGRYTRQPDANYAQQAPAQWPPQQGGDARGFDANSYGTPASPSQRGYPAASYGEQAYQDTELSAADWAGQPGAFGTDPYQQPGQGGELGFAQAEGGDLDAAYDDDDVEYEDEDEGAPRRRWPIKIFATLAGILVIGGGMAYGYKKLGVSEFRGEPPVIKSEAFPAKTKPADAGGKMFPYSDSKIMGRLGDGTPSAPAAAAVAAVQPSPSAAEPGVDAAAEPADDGGPRKVSTLVVGRDGSIQPSTSAAGQVAVPGTALVDAFGRSGGADKSASASPPAAPKKVAPIAVSTINAATPAKAAPDTGSISDRDDAAPVKKAKPLKKVARVETGTATDAYSDASGPPITASSSESSASHSGFVAVLASVPSSSSSRIDALKQFADMQQTYSAALSGKTPDVLSASLAKGKYDRLVVGPPGSRSEANSVCTELKAAGYKGCWVTSY